MRLLPTQQIRTSVRIPISWSAAAPVRPGRPSEAPREAAVNDLAGGRPAAAKRQEQTTSDNPKNQVQSVAKAFAVLKAFGGDVPELTAAEVAARAGLDRGTAFRLIHTLVGLGYLRALPDGGRRFRLTLKCLELGHSVLAA